MLYKLPASNGSAIGYRFSGAIDKDDYDVLIPEMERLAAEHEHIQLLCDLTDFKWERISAWRDDMQFGHEFHRQISKMAIVGDSEAERLIADLAHPLYAESSKYFHDVDAAWDWLAS
jgi:hypothetical protein